METRGTPNDQPRKGFSRSKRREARKMYSPKWDVERTFTVIRATPNIAAAARVLGISAPTLHQRLDRIASHGGMPEDVAKKRRKDHGLIGSTNKIANALTRARTAEQQRVREVVDEIRRVEAEGPTPDPRDEFAARRLRNAQAAAQRSWDERTADAR